MHKLKKLGIREEIEEYMKKHTIDFAAIQETNLETNQIEKRTNFTWYTSGEERLEKEGTFSTGVAIIIQNMEGFYQRSYTSK